MAASTDKPTTTIPELMKQLGDVMGSSVRNYSEGMQAAQAIKPIDPAVLQQAVGQGGALSTAENFANSDIWMMTPESFKQTMQSRPDAMKQAADATSLSDAIFGRTAQRKAMENIAGAGLETKQKSLNIAADLSNSAANRAQSESQFTRNLEQQAKLARDANDVRLRAIKLSQHASGGDSALQSKIYEGLMSGRLHELKDELDTQNHIQRTLKDKDPQAHGQALVKGLKMGIFPEGQVVTVPQATGKTTFFRGKPVIEDSLYRTATMQDNGKPVKVVQRFVKKGEKNPITGGILADDGWVATDYVSQRIPINMLKSGNRGSSGGQSQAYPNGYDSID